MALVSLQEIRIAFGGPPLLDGISLQIDKQQRIGLLGRNGAGKSTLMKILAGLVAPDAGTVQAESGLKIAYFSQTIPHDLDGSVFEIIARGLGQRGELMVRYHREEARLTAHPDPDHSRLHEMHEQLDAHRAWSVLEEIAAITTRMSLNPDWDSRTLSGGQKRRVLLAAALVCGPDLLLLDEPTNHLDATSQEWLESYLKSFKGAVLLVSHDRAFIDQVANEVAELSLGQLTLRPGNYTAYKEIQASELLTLSRTIRQMEKELAHQEAVTQTMLSHRKMASYHAREKVVAKLSSQLTEIRDRARQHQTQLKFNFLPVQNTGDPDKQLLLASDLEIRFQERVLFSSVSFEIRGRDKLCVCGPNGCGKSTLLALLLGKIPQSNGALRLSEKAVFGHMGQHVEFLDEQASVLDELLSRFALDEAGARNLLARYGFRDVDVFKSISVLSGGERARLYLCCLLL